MQRPGAMLTACGSTTDLVVGSLRATRPIDWIAALLPYSISTSLVGVVALPLSRTRSLTGQRPGVEPFI